MSRSTRAAARAGSHRTRIAARRHAHHVAKTDLLDFLPSRIEGNKSTVGPVRDEDYEVPGIDASGTANQRQVLDRSVGEFETNRIHTGYAQLRPELSVSSQGCWNSILT